ncbi:SURF1 family protein [Rubrivivax sp. A210]|uniref:SURF1 family protein n=1 Tax=Rubrivivax sp. A210 TaxID=2772301 RepID=UPI001F4323DE|nr:SURF1 family protein [Rubrivivax sp. A210]
MIPLLAALALVLATARLGLWQLDRAAQKLALQDALLRQRALPALAPAELPRSAEDADRLQHRLVRLQGRWLSARTVYLDNRPLNGRAGFYAVTPLQLPDGSAVLVQRGWLPRDGADRTRIAAPPSPAGEVAVIGRIAPRLSQAYELGAAASGAIRQNLDLAAYAREADLPLRPLAVVQEDGDSPPADGLLRQWPQPAADVHKHYGYAVQWFALCTLTLGLYVWFQHIRPRRSQGRR